MKKIELEPTIQVTLKYWR